ncbi:putative ribonuclease FitB (plasmid) [Variovorax sp. SRS16]|uniref:PIN domain-containing protein n=1 Tax=Variovorax sp. SRS16 TaxID=282217 RepID=UPI0013168AC2|nr:PIN domain-containing protein [Variovorax sp. SRS16]VTU45104.1 putative ribonuclease FitB [Variovorax sp. SRS16]
MIVLDTNVLLEPSKSVASPVVMEWLERQQIDGLYTTSVNAMELLEGIGRLPEGARKRSLESANGKVLNELEGRILPFDVAAAAAYADLMNSTRRNGFSVGVADCMIAAVASIHGFVVATGDDAPFKAMGLKVINPWTA